MWLAPNIFENSCLTHDWHLSMFKHCLTGTFSHVSTVSLAPFLIQHCPRGNFPYVTCMHTHMQPRHFQSLLNPF